MGLRERIQQAGDIPFKDEIILDCADLKQNPFLVETRFASNTSIPTSNIIGSCHPNYAGISWGDFMTKAERIERCIKQNEKIVIKNLNLITAINQRTRWNRWFSKNEFSKFVG